jgi:hypothetical protein
MLHDELGSLATHFASPHITEVMVNNETSVFIEDHTGMHYVGELHNWRTSRHRGTHIASTRQTPRPDFANCRRTISEMGHDCALSFHRSARTECAPAFDDSLKMYSR